MLESFSKTYMSILNIKQKDEKMVIARSKYTTHGSNNHKFESILYTNCKKGGD